MAFNKRPSDPPKVRFAAQRMDVLLSYITAEKPVGRVAPMSSKPDCVTAAKMLDKAINFWRRRDQRDLKQYEWMLTALVYGVAPAKSYWAYERAEESWRVPRVDPVTGEPAGEEIRTQEVDVRNQPSLALISPYDFAWDPSATQSDLSDADYVCYWTYPTLKYVQAMDVKNQAAPKGIYHNTEDLKAETEGSPQSKRRKGRDLQGHVELCEVWTRDRLQVVANGNTLIRDVPNPFLHHDLPFIIGTTQVSLTGGIEPSSEIDLITPIQNDLWNIYKQYGLNLKMANRLIALVDGEMGDIEPILNALRSDNQFVAIAYESINGGPPITWSPTNNLLAAGQAGMEGYKRDMDDMSGVGPYVSGDPEQTVDPKTATEITTLQGASMRRINKTRNMLNAPLQRAGNLELKLAKQFMNKPLEIRIDGYDPNAAVPGKDWSWDYVDPAKVMDADVEAIIRDADESMDQQQKRAEATARMQMTIEVAAASAALGQGAPNIEKAFEEYIEAWGEDEPQDWWLQPPPPPDPLALAAAGLSGVAPPGAGPQAAASPLGPATPMGPGRAAPTPALNGAGS